MRLGRLRTAEWHTIRRRLFTEKAPVRLCDLGSLEVSIPTQLLTNLSTEFGPSILLNEITESAGKWALSSSGQDGLIDKFMALADQSDSVKPATSSPPEAEPSQMGQSAGVSQQQSAEPKPGSGHETTTTATTPFVSSETAAIAPSAVTEHALEHINTALRRSLSKATLELPDEKPSIEPALDSAVVVHGQPPTPIVASQPELQATNRSIVLYCSSSSDVKEQQEPAADPHSLTNVIDRIPPARLIVELAALGTSNDSQTSLPTIGSRASLNDSSPWPQDPTVLAYDSAELYSDNAAAHIRIPPELKRQSTSQSTLHSDDTSPSTTNQPPTTARLLLDLSAEAPLLTVTQIQTLVSTCFDATYHTRLTDHVTDPANVELAARALRQLSPIVSLKHLSQVIHWMVARVRDRITDDNGTEAQPVTLAELAAASPTDRLGLRTGPAWPVLAIAKLLMIVTFDWTPDVAGLFVGYLCQSWPVHVVTRLMAMMAQDEPPSLASLFIKSATWPWSIMQVAELVSLMDCTLQWREAYFSAFMGHYLAHLQRDLPYYDDNVCLPVGGVPMDLHTSHGAGGLPLRASPMSAFTTLGAPASVLLAKDNATRTLFLATLYRTSLAVQQFRLDAMLMGLRGAGGMVVNAGQLVERAAADVLVACEVVRAAETRVEGMSSTNGSGTGNGGSSGSQSLEAAGSRTNEESSASMSLGSLAEMMADAGWLDGSRFGSSTVIGTGRVGGDGDDPTQAETVGGGEARPSEEHASESGQ